MTDTSPRPGSRTAARPPLPPLYPIIDIDLCRIRGIDPVALAAACMAGGARLFQVRQKDMSDGSGRLLDLVGEVMNAVNPSGARVIVNDRADIAAMAGADGVHIGQHDLPPEDVRAIVGEGRIIGLSTHSPEQAEAAARSTADYVAAGPIFATTTKDTGYQARGLDLVRQAANLGKPVVAIGGITLANARGVLEAGATSVAVISDLLADRDPEQRVREFLRSITR